jgi:adenylosuccinate lyase
MSEAAADRYESPLASRYASKAMSALFSERRRTGLFRRIWIALADAERELGLPITAAQVAALEAAVDAADLSRVAELEKKLRHDVMAHVHHFREQAPAAGGVLHLGATSCDVTDNADLVVYRDAVDLIGAKLRAVIRRLRDFALAEKARVCVGYTHFQPAQLTTVGKRATLWLQDFALDHEEFEFVRASFRFRGLRGATGTQDSFLKLFDGDAAKVVELEKRVAARFGFETSFGVCGQTYARKFDARLLNLLSSIAQSAQKFATDLRLLAHENEVEEPFEKDQIGSSAMPYKRNPMRSERICSLARWVIALAQNPAQTAAQQWLERTLDDSANRRLAMAEGFLGADAILDLMLNVTRALVVRPAVIARHVQDHLPFVASEEVLMHAVKRGGDRQELHEVIRTLSHAAFDRLKTEGGRNEFLAEAARHPELGPALAAMGEALAPERFVGRAVAQVETFVAAEIDPLLARYRDAAVADEVRV